MSLLRHRIGRVYVVKTGRGPGWKDGYDAVEKSV
jgi:hypothetical protein